MRSEIKSTCCYCGVGCGVLIAVDDEKIVGLRGDPEHPANRGRLCTKGATLPLSLGQAQRLEYPEFRAQRGVAGQRLSWDAALDQAADRFAEVISRHGPDAVAFYISGQLMTEDYYVFNKLAKGLIGTNNVDTNSRLCMSSAVAGYKQTLGVDAPPCSYEDIGLASTILIAGANPAVAHPIVFRAIEDARAANPALKIVVVDPRRSETAEIADLHLALQPGTDVVLFNGLLQVMIAEQLIDPAYIAAHTEGFAELAALLADFTPAVVAERCGLAVVDIVQAARWFASNGPALSLYCQGLNQSAHGTHNNAALIHLHLATGHIGQPGAGPFSLTGQPNAMGGREVGGMANLLSAHRDLANAEHRAEVARLWGIPEVPAQPGKTAVDLFQAIETGQIKAVWIACTNPAQSLPQQHRVRAALAAADYVVVQEAYATTDTVAYADLLLPATSWGEKEGTVTNSERCITRVQAAVAGPGEAKHDWAIATEFARRLGEKLAHPAVDRLFPYESAEAVFNEHRQSTIGRDLDIGGLSYARLENEGPQQWPCPDQAPGRRRLYTDGRFPTPSGRARFVKLGDTTTADALGPTQPISLLSGRLRDQWHGMSRTGNLPRLFNLDSEPLLGMHPDDMAVRALRDGMVAEVRNARGQFAVRVAADHRLQAGQAWLPMHWGSQFMNSPGVNTLTSSAVDPYSQQPELKHAAVEITALDLPYPLTIIRRCADVSSARTLAQRLQGLLARFPYATLGLYGRSNALVVLRLALAAAPSAELLAELDAAADFSASAGSIEFHDAARGVHKLAWVVDGLLAGVRLAGEDAAQAWLKPALAEDELSSELLRLALAPSARTPIPVAPRHIVCKCADISDQQIIEAFATGADLAGVQERFKCGTFCGSCLPAIKRMAADHLQKQPAAA
ncbi:MAG: molybdopterin-dependent oxidoreductase [Dechloromonas sp.]|nr:molybdopterin-dependent oxidoreductase [Dechloromonas sp.]